MTAFSFSFRLSYVAGLWWKRSWRREEMTRWHVNILTSKPSIYCIIWFQRATIVAIIPIPISYSLCRAHFSYPMFANICIAWKSKQNRRSNTKILPNSGYEKCTQAACRTVPIRAQSWLKYFCANFGYTLCNQRIPMYGHIRHLAIYLFHGDRFSTMASNVK